LKIIERFPNNEWWRGELKGAVGFFPSTFTTAVLHRDAIAAARALYSYTATDDNELTFNEGDIVSILQKYENGWYKGSFHNKIGFFPSNYCKEMDWG